MNKKAFTTEVTEGTERGKTNHQIFSVISVSSRELSERVVKKLLVLFT